MASPAEHFTHSLPTNGFPLSLLPPFSQPTEVTSRLFPSWLPQQTSDFTAPFTHDAHLHRPLCTLSPQMVSTVACFPYFLIPHISFSSRLHSSYPNPYSHMISPADSFLPTPPPLQAAPAILPGRLFLHQSPFPSSHFTVHDVYAQVQDDAGLTCPHGEEETQGVEEAQT